VTRTPRRSVLRENAVAIPLSKLVNVQPLWKQATSSDNPIGDDLYEIVKEHGDAAEAGMVSEVTPDMVRNLRGICWMMITRLCIEADFFSRKRIRAAPEITGEAIKTASYDTVRLAAGLLDRIGVRATAETVSEMIAEVASRLPDEEMDRLVQLVVHLLDTERDYIREVLAS
jgi:hypothetical protein